MMKRLILILATVLLCSSAWAATKVQVMTDGKIDVDKLPTIDFSLETDPASPEDGRIWWNETTKQLKVADPSGVHAFNATSLTAWDITPAAFSFTDVVNATAETVYTSDAITVSGINHPVAITVAGDTSAKYSINSASATATAGTVDVGDTVRAVVTSSADASTAVNATVTIGGVSDAFSVTTAAAVSEFKYVGWPADGDGSVIGASNSTYSVGTDVVIAQRWAATEGGTASAIKINLSSYSGTITYSGVALYKDIGGTITLIGSGSSTLSTGWSNYITLTAASGQSLDFETGDVLYFGAAVSSSGTIGIARNTGTGSNGSYVGGLSNFTEPPATVNLSTQAGSQYCVVLRYE